MPNNEDSKYGRSNIKNSGEQGCYYCPYCKKDVDNRFCISNRGPFGICPNYDFPKRGLFMAYDPRGFNGKPMVGMIILILLYFLT